MPDRLHTLVIVDDEEVVLRALGSQTDWISLGFSLVGTALTASEAIDLICRERPEAVLTDVRMPSMTGIEMISVLRRENLDVEFVILSGYSEFEYARQAITLRVFEYLTKPINDSRFSDTFRRLAVWLDQKRGPEAANAPLPQDALTEKGFPLLTDQMLRQLLHWEGTTAVRYRLALIRYSGSLLQSDIDDLNAFWEARGLAHDFINQNMTVLFAETSKDTSTDADDAAGSIMDELEKYSDYAARSIQVSPKTLCIGLSDVFDRPDAACFAQCHLALRSAMFFPTLCVTHRQAMERRAAGMDVKATAALIYEIAASVARMDANKAYQALDSLFAAFSQALPEQTDVISDLISQLIFTISVQCRLVNEGFASLPPPYQPRIAGIVRLNDIRAVLTQTVESNLQALQHLISENTNSMYQELISYIDTHLCEKLTLEDLAVRVHASAGYVSKLFKRTAGENLINYINRKRVALAARQLRTTPKSIIEISLDCGFVEYHYFCSVFKKYTGTTPAQFRKGKQQLEKDGNP